MLVFGSVSKIPKLQSQEAQKSSHDPQGIEVLELHGSVNSQYGPCDMAKQTSWSESEFKTVVRSD